MVIDALSQQTPVFLTDEKRLSLISFFKDLVETPSPSSQEGELAAILREKCLSIGFDEVTVDEAGSVIAIKRNGEGPTLLFDAHMDTAKPTRFTPDKANPYEATYDGERITGLGSCEGKASIAPMLFGLEKFIAEDTFNGTLIAVFLVLGNFCEGGSLKLILENEGLQPDCIILGEPSDLQIIRGHRGRTHFNVIVKGRSCHSATPQLGKNAIMVASRLLFNIDLLSDNLLHDDFLGPGTIAVTKIQSDAPTPNSLPHTCQIVIDRRLTVGETSSRARSELENAIIRENIDAEIMTAQFEATSYTGYAFNREGSFNAWTLEEKHPLVTSMLSILKELSPEKAVATSSTFSTDGAYSVVERGIPTIGFGPGNAALVHTGEEWVNAVDLVIAAQVYYRFSQDFFR